MNTMKARWALLIPLLLSTLAQNLTYAAKQNIALGKTYEWSCPPTYDLCTDQADRAQLTDGISKGAVWVEMSTVGWVHRGRVSVTIDLGASSAIS